MASPPEQPGDKPSMLLLQEASRTCTLLVRRTLVSSSIMTSALEISKLSGVIKQRVLSDHFAGATGLQEMLKEMAFIKPYDPIVDYPKIAELLAEQTAVNGEMVITAAVIVLSHSTADDVFTGACNLAITLDQSKWIPELNLERTFTLKTLNEKGKQGIFALELERFRKGLAAKSLPSRAELLFRHVPIRHNKMYGSTDPQHFRLPALKEADELRNSIVHGSGLPRIDLERSMNTVQFLHEAAMTALRSLGYEYALPLDYQLLLQTVPSPRPT